MKKISEENQRKRASIIKTRNRMSTKLITSEYDEVDSTFLSFARSAISISIDRSGRKLIVK